MSFLRLRMGAFGGLPMDEIALGWMIAEIFGSAGAPGRSRPIHGKLQIVAAMRLALFSMVVAAALGAGGAARAGEGPMFFGPRMLPMGPPRMMEPGLPLRPMPGQMMMRPLPRRFGGPRICFGPAETRDKIAANRLADPFQAFRTGRLQGEALRAKLCRLQDEFVYEVIMLRPNGRIVHIFVDAQTGTPLRDLDRP